MSSSLLFIFQWVGFFIAILLLNFLYVKYFIRFLPVSGDVTQLPSPDKVNESSDGTYKTFEESESGQ